MPLIQTQKTIAAFRGGDPRRTIPTMAETAARTNKGVLSIKTDISRQEKETIKNLGFITQKDNGEKGLSGQALYG